MVYFPCLLSIIPSLRCLPRDVRPHRSRSKCLFPWTSLSLGRGDPISWLSTFFPKGSVSVRVLLGKSYRHIKYESRVDPQSLSTREIFFLFRPPQHETDSLWKDRLTRNCKFPMSKPTLTRERNVVPFGWQLGKVTQRLSCPRIWRTLYTSHRSWVGRCVRVLRSLWSKNKWRDTEPKD